MKPSNVQTVSSLWAQSIRNGKVPLIRRASLRDLQRERERLQTHHAYINARIAKAVRARRAVKVETLYALRNDIVFKCDMVLHEIARRLDMREKQDAAKA